MEVIDYNTRLFKNIFPDYDTFSSWYKSTGLSDETEDVPSKKTFTIIAFEFNDSHVAYSPESFKQKFAIVLYTNYREFEQTTKAISDLMSLTDEEIRRAGEVVTNIADIPETASSTDIDEVDFVSNQQKMINIKGMAQVKREQLGNKRAFTVKSFLNKFRSLFIKIIPPAYTFVVKEEDDN